MYSMNECIRGLMAYYYGVRIEAVYHTMREKCKHGSLLGIFMRKLEKARESSHEFRGRVKYRLGTFGAACFVLLLVVFIWFLLI